MQNNTSNKSTEEEQRRVLERLDRFSHFTDSSIGIPFTKFQIGAESVIGLLPVVGDAVGLVLSCYVLVEAQRIGATNGVKLRMLGNMLIDFLGGLLPVVGDVFDAFFKANTRNTRILKEHLEKQIKETPPEAR